MEFGGGGSVGWRQGFSLGYGFFFFYFREEIFVWSKGQYFFGCLVVVFKKFSFDLNVYFDFFGFWYLGMGSDKR